MLKNKQKFQERLALFVMAISFYPILFANRVLAQTVDPGAEINAIVERVIQIATQVGSAVLILFIVKDAFELLNNKDNPAVRGALARDIFLLIIAAIFLFRPDFVLGAIRFIANA